MPHLKHSNSPNNRLLFGLAYRQRNARGRWEIRFFWKRVATVCTFFAICGYSAFATACYFHFKYLKDYEDVSYFKMYTLLFNIDGHRKEMGEYKIAKANDLLDNPNLDQKQFIAALNYLRVGVFQSPTNSEARMLLFKMFMHAGFKERALKVLDEGLLYARSDTEYLQFYLKVQLELKNDAAVIELTENWLKENSDEKMAQLLATAAATAHYHRGNFDLAEDIISDYGLGITLDGLLVSARIDWERGLDDVAIAKLKSNLNKFANKNALYAELSRFYLELLDYEQARSFTIKRIINSPLEAGPKIDLLYILHEIGQINQAEENAEEILLQYKDDGESLLRLANYAAQKGQVELAEKLLERAKIINFRTDQFSLLLINAEINRNAFTEALNTIDALLTENADLFQRHLSILDGQRAVANYGAGNIDRGNIFVQQLLQRSDLRAGSTLEFVGQFRRLGFNKVARELLLHAHKSNPMDQNTLTQLIDLELELKNSVNIGAYFAQLLKMRRPSIALLKKADQVLRSDHMIFTENRDQLLAKLNSIINP